MGKRIAFIGGGNMASAIIGGLLRQGFSAADIDVVEPWAEARTRLATDFGLQPQPEAGAFLASADLIVWAVKPQTFKEAAAAVNSHNRTALHLSVAAGITTDSIATWLGSERIIRTMPNTPALIGKGITALFGRPGVTQADKDWANEVIATTGATVWLTAEAQLDAVTALSGSGPAYMFYFMEAMTDAGMRMGLERDQAYQLAVATFIGAGELALASSEAPESLRAKVTSKGGTTYAAITSMDESGIKDLFAKALFAAHHRAGELGTEFGKA
ncbi:ProC Pyrroline-5-carboxylate reductase [Comamonadaceae bacterium]